MRDARDWLGVVAEPTVGMIVVAAMFAALCGRVEDTGIRGAIAWSVGSVVVRSLKEAWHRREVGAGSGTSLARVVADPAISMVVVASAFAVLRCGIEDPGVRGAIAWSLGALALRVTEHACWAPAVDRGDRVAAQ